MPYRFNNSGFTLIETVVAVAIFAILALGVIGLVSGVLTTSNKESALLNDVDQARKVTYNIIGELRDAVTSNTGAYTIGTAQDQQLTFYSQLPGTTPGVITRVRYYLTGTTLYRATLTPTGTPLAYTNPEVVTPVENDVANGATPLFYYYDSNYNATTNNTPLVQPVNINSISLIKINLIVTNKAGVTGTNTFTVTGQSAIRNLKTNLGS